MCFLYDVIECFFLGSSVSSRLLFGGKLVQFKESSLSCGKVAELLKHDEEEAFSDVIFGDKINLALKYDQFSKLQL